MGAIGMSSSSGPVTLKNCVINGGNNSIGLFVGGIGTYTLDHSTIKDVASGITASDGNVVVTDSLIDLGAVSNANGLTSYFAGAIAFANPTSLQVSRTTIVGSGINQRGILVGADSANESMDFDLSDSVIYGTGSSFDSVQTVHAAAAGATTFDVTRSAYNLSLASDTGPNPIATTTSAIVNLATTAPGFVNPAARDYRPAAGSPLIDAGPSSAIAAVDVIGQPRVVDGNGDGIAMVDLGALEYQPPATIPGSGVEPIATAKIVAKPKKSFKVGKKGGFGTAKKGAPSFSVSFSNSAKAKFTLKSIGKKKKKLKSVKGSQTLTVKNGTTKFGFRGKWNKKKLKVGKYRVSITPLSPTGKAGKAVTVDIKLVK
jgi:hypothetical protein